MSRDILSMAYGSRSWPVQGKPRQAWTSVDIVRTGVQSEAMQSRTGRVVFMKSISTNSQFEEST